MLKKVAVMLSVMWSLSVYAHPHSWIDMKTKITGTHGAITQLSMSWEMDPITSAYALDGMDTSTDQLPVTLASLAHDAISNMYDDRYFSHLFNDKVSADFIQTKQAYYQLNGAKLTLNFDVKLKQPLAIPTEGLHLQVYDPTYYVDMAWSKETDIELSGDLANKCHITLHQAKPTQKQINEAALIPANVQPEENLGVIFTQTVDIHC